MTDIEVVELPGPTELLLAYEPPDPLAGAEIVSISDGAPGPPAASARFEYQQGLPQSVWPLAHNRGRAPVAWVLRDTTGRECSEYSVELVDSDTARVAMDIPTAGTITLIF